MRSWVVVVLGLLYGTFRALAEDEPERLGHDQRFHHKLWNVSCKSTRPERERDRQRCEPRANCARFITDDLFDLEDVLALRKIAEKGMAVRPRLGGPTIVDLNTGFIRDTSGLINIYKQGLQVFTREDYSVYWRIQHRLKAAVQSIFGTSHLYFTAPTFITRLDAIVPWEPQQIHDEYWHLHVDKNNTPHYDYGGLLYLSEYDREFTGGILTFYGSDEKTREQIIEPRPGRVLLFTSGPENPHSVSRVISGSRFVLSFWFTCDAAREFQPFLDGEAHTSFSPTKEL